MKYITRELTEVENITPSTKKACRLGTPRILFLLHAGHVRPDSNLTKRVDILDKLTERIQDQIYSHYRKSRIVSNSA